MAGYTRKIYHTAVNGSWVEHIIRAILIIFCLCLIPSETLSGTRVIIIGGSGGGGGGISLDVADSYCNGGAINCTTGSNCQHSFTFGYGSGNNRLFVVAAIIEDGADTDIDDINVGGVSCTEAVRASGGTGNRNIVELWYCLDASLPAGSGAATVDMDTNNETVNGAGMRMFSFIGVKQEVPDDSGTDTCTADCGNTNPVSMALTAAAAGSVFIGGVTGSNGSGGGTYDWGSDQGETEVSSGDCGTIFAAMGQYELSLGSGSNTQGASTASADHARAAYAGAVWEPN